MIEGALDRGDTSAARLARFRKQRQGRVAYAQALSLAWAFGHTGPLWPMGRVRDLGIRYLARRPGQVVGFLRELVDRGMPRMRTHAAVLLP